MKQKKEKKSGEEKREKQGKPDPKKTDKNTTQKK